MRARLGTPKAITATAHKLARIVYHLVTACQEFEATVFESLERALSIGNIFVFALRLGS